MDLKLALGFCKKWQVRAQTPEEAAQLRFDLPFAGVKLTINPETENDKRPRCRAGVMWGGRGYSPEYRLTSLKRAALYRESVFRLPKGWELGAVSTAYAQGVSVTIDLRLVKGGIRMKGGFLASFIDAGPHDMPIIRAIHDTLRGVTCPEMLLDWLAQNRPNPNLDRALGEIYG